MWTESDGKEIKKIFERINNLKLSKFSEDLLFQVLFTNSYPPKKNLTSDEFLRLKSDMTEKRIELMDTVKDMIKTRQGFETQKENLRKRNHKINLQKQKKKKQLQRN